MSDFKGRRFPTDIILVCVRLYCKYGISYRMRFVNRLFRLAANMAKVEGKCPSGLPMQRSQQKS